MSIQNLAAGWWKALIDVVTGLNARFGPATAADPGRAAADADRPPCGAATPDAPTPASDPAPTDLAAFTAQTAAPDHSPSADAASQQTQSGTREDIPDATADLSTEPAATLAAVPCPAPSPTLSPAPMPDPEVEALRTKRTELEAKVDMLMVRHADMTRCLETYQLSQYRALGEVLRECLALRCRWLAHVAGDSGREEDVEAARAAEADWAGYEGALETDAQAVPAALDAGEEEELKRLYRAAAMRCHPDRVDEARRDDAHQLFQRTRQAYVRRDLGALREIFESLAGEFGAPAEPPAGEHAGAVRRAISRLQEQAADLILAIQTLQIDPVYRRALDPETWEAEFDDARRRFKAECDALRARLRTAGIA